MNASLQITTTLRVMIFVGPLALLACTGELDGGAPGVREQPGLGGGVGTGGSAPRGSGDSTAGAGGAARGSEAAGGGAVAGAGGAGGNSPDAGIAPRTPDAASSPVAPGPAVPCLVPGATVEPRTLTGAFVSSCAGCHGPAGQGLGAVPAVPGKRTFSEFIAVVRKGQKETMPAFPEAHVTDDDLFRDYVKLTGTAAKVPTGLRCTNRVPLADDAIAVAVRDGLAAWRKPDKDGAACVNCHGPEPFDLAYVGYDDATIIRRTLPHLDQTEAFKIVKYVQALRVKHNLPARDPMAFRPFQPGGSILPARSSDPADRDHAFGLSLAGAAPTLAGARIDTLAKAVKAKDELLAINPRTFPIAIPVNRWTEDKFHGVEHASLNEWITEVPALPRDAALARQMYALHDAYIASPSWETLWPIDKFVATSTTTAPLPGSDANAQFKLKYRSALFAQQHFRDKANGLPGLEGAGAAPHPGHNQIWDVGDIARQVVSNVAPNVTAATCTPTRCLRVIENGQERQYALPKHMLDNLNPTMPLRDEYSRLRMSWFWAGWQVDTTLYQSAQNGSTQSSEYFTGSLYEGGYYNHLTYVRFRKNLAVAYDPGGAADNVNDGRPSEQRMAHDASVNFGYFLGYGAGYDDKHLPPSGEKRDLYTRLLGNAMRMVMFLMVDEVGRTGKAYERKGVIGSVPSTFEAFLAKFGGAAQADAALAAQTRTALAATCEIAPRYHAQPGYCGK